MREKTLRWMLLTALAGVGLGLVLSALLVVKNFGVADLGLLSVAELVFMSVWIAMFFQFAASSVLAVAWPVLRFSLPRIFDGRFDAYLLSGLVAGNLTWALWNKLTLIKPWESGGLSLSTNLVLQALGLALFAGLSFWALFNLPRAKERYAPFLTCSASSLLIAVLLLSWSGAAEKASRTYEVTELPRSALDDVQPADHDNSAGARRQVVVLGLDGLSWNVLIPLLKDGALPSFERLLASGAAGHLDNHDESISPRIWTSLFSGMAIEDHGIHGFEKLVLKLSGTDIPDLLYMMPATEPFFGLGGLISRLPNPGLWRLRSVESDDLKSKLLWDVAAESGHRVVVANVVGNIPVPISVYPTNGVMMTFFKRRAHAVQAFPEAVVEQWKVAAETCEPTDKECLLMEKARFTAELARDLPADLVVFYTHYIDATFHGNWHDLQSRADRFRLRATSRDEWERGLTSLDTPTVDSYRLADRVLGEFLDAFPEAVFVVVSDHGWSFRGYLHYGSQDGVLILSGPGVRSGTDLGRVDMLDVAPTLLAASGLPVSRELPGSLVEGAFTETPRPFYIEAFGPPERGGEQNEELDEELVERLKALGYLQ